MRSSIIPKGVVPTPSATRTDAVRAPSEELGEIEEVGADLQQDDGRQ